MSGARNAFSSESNTGRYALSSPSTTARSVSGSSPGSGAVVDSSTESGGLDLRRRRLRERISDHEEGGGQVAVAEDLQGLLDVPDEPDGAEDVRVDRQLLALLRARSGGGERAGIDARRDIADVDDLVV